ncbi:MAG: hypothetical protein RJA99_4957 [Pseudomonadota bacterium]|jgi:hypothetical protein
MGHNERMRRIRIGLVAAAALAGCASPPPSPPPARPLERPAPALTASPSVAPAFPVPGACERMVFLARQEWALFGSPEVLPPGGTPPAAGAPSGTAAAVGGTDGRLVFPDPASPTHELHAPMLSRVLVYWYSVTRAPIVGPSGELRPWSAAFVSWLARAAGLGGDEFPATALHWDYIERFLRPRPTDAFETRDAAGTPPRIGDLVCQAREGTVELAQRTGFVPLAALRRGAYHCDVVVASRPGELQTIGGNVSDVVALARVPIDTAGRLLPDLRRPWAAVVARRGTSPVSACASLPPIPERAAGPAP